MAESQISRYGSWKSPITSDLIVSARSVWGRSRLTGTTSTGRRPGPRRRAATWLSGVPDGAMRDR